MDSAADKEERKREAATRWLTLSYNRVAQREFRRTRKEHLRSLEQAQKEQSFEQSEEIECLRCQNDELRRENEALRAQIYRQPSSHGMLSIQMAVRPLGSDGRQYSLSPSISAASIEFRHDANGGSIIDIFDITTLDTSIRRPLSFVIPAILYGTCIRTPS
ncbi:uncharacterized protein LY89DRAFT_585760 [Mollisia scopiformis]|uniref:BZIP domain-containing protein n=1 Tax=Mollisia scopiformis TaxID=149040 RepID=A0A194XAN0_MOLSC|nr:uncharacterized protein LY89DRAFT_585760 [Mollisia scopiformis]KUJ17204.1 hypothetical protein LY89DRAFT_585760 [Mollisia scopiformis]